MRRAAAAYGALASFQADFRQRIDDDFIDHDEERGTLYQQGPSRFAMRFSHPRGTAIVIDGRQVWIYQPEDIPGQVSRHPMPSDPTYGYNILGWLLERPTEKYRATWLREELVERKPVDVIRLEPTSPTAPFRQATLWIDRESSLPRRIETDERHQKRNVTLSRIRTNETIPIAIFTFTVPSGVRVVEQQR